MTAIDDDNTLEAGEWGVFVARTVGDVRRELGEATASRVARLLHDQKAEAIDAARGQLDSINDALSHAREEVAEERQAHQRLQADLGRMEAAVHQAKEDAARIRSEAQDLATRRRAEGDALAEAEAHRISEAWEEVRQQELDVATRRSELLDLDEQAALRRAEIDQAATELAALRDEIETDRAEAQRLVEEAIERLAEIEREAEQAVASAEAEPVEDAPPEVVLDLRDDGSDERQSALDERERELDEWESELVARARELEQHPLLSPSKPAGPPSAGWGRRTFDDD